MEACRGAVKFGDDLTKEQCKSMISELAKCRLPFQCAHGRPSVVPLTNLYKNKVIYSFKMILKLIFKA
jgi:DNA mismatch repair protein MLH3